MRSGRKYPRQPVATGTDGDATVGRVAPWHVRWRWWLLLPVLLAVVLGYYRLQWPTFMAFVEAVDHDAMFMPDFVHHYYPMSSRILSERVPVPRYYYTSFFALLTSPLGLLERAPAMTVWLLGQLIGLALLIAVSARLLRLSPRGTTLLVVLHVTSYPVLHNFKWGQVSYLITACAMAAFVLTRQGRRVLAGATLAFAAAVKFYPALFLAPFVVRREWRVLAAFVLAALLFYAGLPAAVLGPGDWWRFERAASLARVEAQWFAYDVNSHYLVHVGSRWYTIISSQPAPSAFLVALRIVGYLVALGCLALLWRLRRDWRDERGLSLVPVFLCLPFILKTSWPHYFVCLPFCQAALLTAGLGRVRCGEAGARLLTVLPVVSIALSSVVVFNFFPTWGTYNTCGVLFFANLLLVIASAGLIGPGVGRAAPAAAVSGALSPH